MLLCKTFTTEYQQEHLTPKGNCVGPSSDAICIWPKAETIMSYSRWIDSKFYTYWCSSKAQRAEDEILMVHTELTENREYKYEDCVRMLHQPKFIFEVEGVEDNIDHLEMYRIMYSFVRDVSDHYGKVSGQNYYHGVPQDAGRRSDEPIHAVLDRSITSGS